jgi:hypothetical protein
MNANAHTARTAPTAPIAHFDLLPGLARRVHIAPGATLCVRRGTVWLTVSGRGGDMVQSAGTSRMLHDRGEWVIEALGGPAQIELRAQVGVLRRTFDALANAIRQYTLRSRRLSLFN